MKPLFEQMTVVGLGLLGGSLAQACRKHGFVGKIVGFGRNLKNLEKAKKLNLIDDWYSNLSSAVKGSDLVIICTPVGSIVSRVREMIPALKRKCILTDVGSVKAPLVKEIERLLPDNIHFIGSHPIAGSEKSGFEASYPDLFEGANCIVTRTPKTDPTTLECIIGFWQKLGSTVLQMDAEEHDMVYGAVSHLPHIVAFTLVNTIAGLQTKNSNDIFSFGGKGFEDMSRLAFSEPVMWKDICILNKRAVLDIIERFEDTLGEIKSGIGKEEEDFLVKTFLNAREVFTRVGTSYSQVKE